MVSIIIPVLNEETNIEKLIYSIQGLAGKKEVIFVDGGSTDRTVYICRKYGRVINSKRGRAFQMNEGAKAALGEVIWFVHADSIVHADSLRLITEAIDEGNVGGGFSLYFYDDNSLFMKYISISSNIRAKKLGLIFGDQGIFVEKYVFEKIKGYAEIQLMEDWEFSKKLKTEGRVKFLDSPIGSSARRFQKGGKLRTHLLMHMIKFLYIFGVPHEMLNSIYRGKAK